jgi:2',3'-cyclic-nucleotide 2'-phosphodiesterase (5'-nucleotidase family)
MAWKHTVWLQASIIALVLLLGAASAFAQRETLTILTINDVYEIVPVQGRGGLAELMTMLKTERATATHHMTTVNGDFLSPSLMSALLKGAQMIDLFNALGVDIVAFGNHEFDFGPDITMVRMTESKFPWLSANVLGPDRKPFGSATATLTRQVGPFTVGFFGLLSPDTATLSSPGANVTFLPVIPAAQAAVEALRQAGADVIIALTHLTIAEDRQLARQVPGISLILGGHEHDPITWYEDNTLIHKSGYDAHYLGRIDLVMDKTTTEKGPRVTVTPSWRMLANHGIPPDPEVAARVAEYTTRLDSELAQPLGQSQTALNSQRGDVRTRETTMGNLVADALREALQAEAVLINGGGIRGDRLYEPGTTLTRRDIFRELPFGNVGVLLELSGASLLAALEHGVSKVEAKAGQFPHVAGIRFVYNPRQPAGSRVVQATINGVPIDLAASYRIATVDYLFNGGDGYTSLATGKPLVDTSGGILVATIVMQYIARHGTVAPQVEGRITVREE